MGTRDISVLPSAMVTRWRCRRPCTLERGGHPVAPAVIREVDGTGARLEAPCRLAPGEQVAIRHPDAGRIEGRVTGGLDRETHIAFSRDAASVAFALAVIAGEMSHPG